jgi:protein-tyrosine phosphatase
VELNGRELSWDGCVNARDLGGLGQVRPGAEVRMEQPRRLTEAGWAAVWAYGVRTVLDLRGTDEYEPERAPRPAGSTTVRLPLDPVGTPFYERWTKIENLASPLYFPAMQAGAAQEEIIADLLSYDRMKQRYDEIGVPDQLTAVNELLASRDTTIEASLTSTIASLTMPDFLLENGLSAAELAALRTRLTT